MRDLLRPGWLGFLARLRTVNDYWVDGALAAAVAVPVSVPFVTAMPGDVTALGALLNAGTVVPLVWRRRAPFAVAITIAAFAVLVSAYARPGQILQYGALAACYTVADLARRWQRWVFFGGLLVILPVGSLWVQQQSAADFMLTILLPVSALLLGSLARVSRARAEALEERAGQLARGRESEAAKAVAQERARIARDMHDVLAHAVSIMVVQAEAGPVAIQTSPARAVRVFDEIALAGREAMVQLRRMMGVLKDEPDTGVRSPPPTLAAIPVLVNQVTRTGLRAELRSAGEPRFLPADAEVAAYRIVQEALTNTLKHAGATCAAVRLHWTDICLKVTVTDDGRGQGDAAVVQQPGGHGLIGLRERAVACGGQAEAGPMPGGGFRVTAQLPYLEPEFDARTVPAAGLAHRRSGNAGAACPGPR